MDIHKIMSLLHIKNVDELATHLGKSRATTYKYGLSEKDPLFVDPPSDVTRWLLAHGIPTKLIFGVSKSPGIIIPRLKRIAK